MVLRWLDIEVTLQLTKLSSPLAAFLAVAAEYFETRERSLETLVGEIIKVVLTARAWLLVSLDPRNADLAVAIATGGDLVGLTENQQTHWTLTLNYLWRTLNELISQILQGSYTLLLRLHFFLHHQLLIGNMTG